MTFISHSAKETRTLAAALARGLKKNDCLSLVGDFGSGKTTFVRGLLEGLRSAQRRHCGSPSYVTLKIYRGALPVYHFDFYRLEQGALPQNLGLLDDFIQADGVCVIEWADRVKKYLPADCLKINFKVLGEKKRSLKFATTDPRLHNLLHTPGVRFFGKH